jgi:hypothetical protein
MARLAEPSDLALRLGVTFTPEQEERAAAILDDVSAEILAVADPTTWEEPAGTLDPDVPPAIVVLALRVAKREWHSRPFDSETIGDYTYRAKSASVELSASERRTIRKLAGVSTVGTIALKGVQIEDVLYVPVDYGGDPVPWEMIVVE